MPTLIKSSVEIMFYSTLSAGDPDLAAGVTVTPGTEFSPDSTDSIRLNFSQNHVAAVGAAERIAELVERYRSDVGAMQLAGR